jgi:tetratricopeptide (TPR) repeat protein
MARGGILDAPGRPEASLVISFLLFCCAVLAPARAADRPAQTKDSQRISAVQKLYGEKRWEEAARAAQGPAGQSVELDYLAGMSLAHLQRWAEAREAFSTGHRKAPGDARFLIERAGAEYRLKDFKSAKNDLREALRRGSQDPYTREFLGTLYLLEGNIEAALKYWNTIQKPQLMSLQIDPSPRLQGGLLDRAITFPPVQTMERNALLDTKARLKNLEVFPAWHMELEPAGPEGYSAKVRVSEDSGWGSSWMEGALSLLRGLPYETVYPRYSNIEGEAANFDSLVRWDLEKRRVSADFSMPLFHDPARRVRIFFDARNENWNLSQTFSAAGTPLTDLNLRRIAGGIELRTVQNGWWGWNTGVEVETRSFRNVGGSLPSGAAAFFTDSNSFDAWLGMERWLIRIPERRFTLEGEAGTRFGRGFAADLGPFGRLSGSLRAHWLPKARGDDYELGVELRGADTFGEVPLDQLFQLGVERDNDLWLRGQAGTIGGRKGRAPLGRRYLLLNTDFSKILYNAGFFRVQCGPFLDSGAIADPSRLFGSREWLWNAGAQMRIRLLGNVSVVLSYGWNLRNGAGTFYATTLR